MCSTYICSLSLYIYLYIRLNKNLLYIDFIDIKIFVYFIDHKMGYRYINKDIIGRYETILMIGGLVHL